MRRSSRARKPAASYRDADDSDSDADRNAEGEEADGGPSYTASRDDFDGADDDDEGEEDDGEDASGDEGDDDGVPRGTAQGKATKGSPSKKAATVVRRAKKLSSAAVGMKGLVEYSTSDAAGCKVCHEKIAYGELRVGKFRRAAKFDGFIPLWYHRRCFFDRWWHTIAYVEQLGGADRLRWPDIESLDKEIASPPRSAEEARDWAALKTEVNRVWALQDMLAEANIQTRDLRAILSENKQPIFGKQDVLRVRVADIWLHGALPQCPQCKNGVLYYYPNQGLYRCMSYSSAWSKCDFSSPTVVRVPFVLPAEIAERFAEVVAAAPPSMAPLVPRRRIVRKERKPRAAKAAEAGGEAAEKKPSKGKGKGGKKGKAEAKGEEPSAFVRGTVHPDCEEPNARVVQNDEGEFLSVAMSMSDVTTGTNSYYILQLLQLPAKGAYALFCKWGRTGTHIGSSKLTEYKRLEKATEAFESLFADKTGNAWAARHNFTKRPGRLCPLDLDAALTTAVPAAATAMRALSLSGGGDQALDPRVARLVGELFSTEMLLATLEALDVDVKRMPVGKISRRQVQAAYLILRDVDEALRQQVSGDGRQRLLELTNQFYTMIPHQFGRRRPPVLDCAEILKEKFALLDALLNIEIAASLDRLGQGAADPVMVRYRSLRTQIRPVDPNSPDYQIVNQYLAASASENSAFRIRLVELFAVRREGESEACETFASCLPNHMLLWHGSRASNFVGILSQGLRIAPPEAPPSGYVFGKGVYFADVAAKSAAFCGATVKHPTAFLLLSQVALGAPAELVAPQYMEAPLSGSHSTWAKGKRGPPLFDRTHMSHSDDQLLQSCGAPLGALIERDPSAELAYSEFVVYDTRQVCQRFLVKVAFEFPQ